MNKSMKHLTKGARNKNDEDKKHNLSVASKIRNLPAILTCSYPSGLLIYPSGGQENAWAPFFIGSSNFDNFIFFFSISCNVHFTLFLATGPAFPRFFIICLFWAE